MERASGSSDAINMQHNQEKIMKMTVTLFGFRQAFLNAGRSNHFSWEGLEVLFDFLREQEEDTGIEMELDVIGLCWEFAEETPEAIAVAFGIPSASGTDITEDEVMDWLQDRTMVVGKTASGIIYQQEF
jgi:hypothetical protein